MSTSRTRAPGEMVYACLMLLMSAFLLWTAVGISGFKSYTSAGSFPMAAAAVMVVCALINVGQTARSVRQPGEPGESLPRQFMRAILPGVVVWTSLAIVGYMILLERLGFVVSSYLFLIVCMWLLGGRRVWMNLGVSAVVLAAIYVVFHTAFSVVLPPGTVWQGVFK